MFKWHDFYHLINELLQHHSTIGDVISSRYLWVMFQIPKEKHVLASDKSEMKIQRYPKAILSCDNIENCKDTSNEDSSSVLQIEMNSAGTPCLKVKCAHHFEGNLGHFGSKSKYSKCHPSGAKLFSACANLESLGSEAFFLEKMEGFPGIPTSRSSRRFQDIQMAVGKVKTGAAWCSCQVRHVQQCCRFFGHHTVPPAARASFSAWGSAGMAWLAWHSAVTLRSGKGGNGKSWKIHENPLESPINEGFNGTNIYIQYQLINMVDFHRHVCLPYPKLFCMKMCSIKNRRRTIHVFFVVGIPLENPHLQGRP